MRSASIPALLAIFCVACVPERKTSDYKLSDLEPHYSRSVSSGYVFCDAYFTHKSDSATPVTLEDSAFMTCNGYEMTRSGPYFTGGVPFTSGEIVRISLIRKIDGSTLTDSETVY